MRDCFFCFWDKFVDVCLLRLGVFFFLCFLLITTTPVLFVLAVALHHILLLEFVFLGVFEAKIVGDALLLLVFGLSFDFDDFAGLLNLFLDVFPVVLAFHCLVFLSFTLFRLLA